MAEPGIQYVTAPDGVSIAYTTYGQGGTPLVYMEPPHVSHLQREWSMPWNIHVHKIERLSSHRLLVRFDPRGSGLSDRTVADQSLEARVSDLQAVADRLRLERFAIHAVRNASLVALAFAAGNPGRVSHLVLEEPLARGMEFWDTPVNRGLIALAEYVWEIFTETNARVSIGWDHDRVTVSGERAGDAAAAMAAYTRACVGQADFLSFATAELSVDLTEGLPWVSCPALVYRYGGGLTRGQDEDAPRRVAARLPDARYMVFASPERMIDALNDFIGDVPVPSAQPADIVPSLRTILFTDLEGHTAMMQRLGDEQGRALLREHERLTREALATHGGTEVKAMGDGFMASFGSAQRALECAMALQRSFHAEESPTSNPEAGIRVRIGINAGEPIAEADDLFGSSVILAARIASQAEGGEVLVSDVIRQLVAGKGFLFHDRGESNLRGFEEAVRVWALRWQP